MKFRIIKIKGCKTCNEVCLIKQRDNDGVDYVQIVAWHKDKEGSEYIQDDDIVLGDNSPVLIERYICDFSEVSANQFANSFQE